MIKAKFVLSSTEMTAEEMQNAVSSQATKIVGIGERLNGAYGPLAKENYLIYELGEDAESIDPLLERLGFALLGELSEIKQQHSQIGAELSIAIYLTEDSEATVPSCHIPEEWTISLGLAGAAIDVDIVKT